MKILVVAPPYLTIPNSRYGGIEQVTVSRAQALSRAGHRVTLLGPVTSEIRDVECISFQAIGFPNRSDSTDLIRWVTSSAALRYALPYLSVKLRDSYDVVVNDAYRHEPWLTIVSATRFGVWRTLNVLHSNFPVDLIEASGLARFYKRLAFGSLNSPMQHVLAQRGYRTSYFPNGVDTFESPVASLSPESYLLFIGRIAPAKGVAEAIEIARGMGRKLLIVGPIHDFVYFRHYVQPKLGADISHLGEIERKELLALLSHAFALVFASKYSDPQPSVLLEALATGVPVIALRPGPLSGFFDSILPGFNYVVGSNVDEVVKGARGIEELDRVKIQKHTQARWGWDQVTRTIYDPILRQLAHA